MRRVIKETEVAAVATEWLQSQGWECWFEVPAHGGVADIVAVRGSVLWIVETKVTFSLDLFTQCWRRLQSPCSGVIAVAAGRYPNPILSEWAASRGIGVAKVTCDGRFSNVVMDQWPALRRLDTSAMRRKLRPEMQTHSVPGSQSNRWTPFKSLVSSLQEELKAMPLQDASTLPCMSDYRRRSPSAQKRALTDYLKRGLIPGWTTETRDRCLWVVPAEKVTKS